MKEQFQSADLGKHVVTSCLDVRRRPRMILVVRGGCQAVCQASAHVAIREKELYQKGDRHGTRVAIPLLVQPRLQQ